MKRILFAAALLIVARGTTTAQNLQLHYDFGPTIYEALDEDNGDRQSLTLTYEHFSADKWGSWYYFVDFDFYSRGIKGAYTEISREFTFAKPSPKASLDVHVEYDGGLCAGRDNTYGSIYQSAALLGAAINGHNADYSTTWSVQAMYKQYFKGYDRNAFASYQLTGIWSTTFANKALTFSGFADVWYDNEVDGNYIFITEPQLWYNIGAKVPGFNLSVGTEVEISNNFCASKTLPVWNTCSHTTLFVNPTIALKWSF